jgi:hypothetical protein
MRVIQQCESTTVMKDNIKITAGRKEMYHREENVMNMAPVCSSCRSSTLFFRIIIPLNEWPAMFFWGEVLQYCKRTLNWVVCVHLPDYKVHISVLYTFSYYYLALISSSHLLTVRLISVLYCHALVKYGMQLLWVYLTGTAKYRHCSFCPRKADCTLS